MQRKQFGKRGLTPNVGQRWGTSQSQQAPSGAGAAYAGASYASTGYGAPAQFQAEETFSVWKMIRFFLVTCFSFYGRIGRAEYWIIGFARWFVDILLLVTLYKAAWPALQALTAGRDSMTEIEVQIAFFLAIYGTPTGYICSVLLIISTISYWSLLVRRQHDRDVSGFWLLLLFVPIVNIFYGIFLFFALGFFAGTPGPNRFDTATSRAHVFD